MDAPEPNPIAVALPADIQPAVAHENQCALIAHNNNEYEVPEVSNFIELPYGELVNNNLAAENGAADQINGGDGIDQAALAVDDTGELPNPNNVAAANGAANQTAGGDGINQVAMAVELLPDANAISINQQIALDYQVAKCLQRELRAADAPPIVPRNHPKRERRNIKQTNYGVLVCCVCRKRIQITDPIPLDDDNFVCSIRCSKYDL